MNRKIIDLTKVIIAFIIFFYFSYVFVYLVKLMGFNLNTGNKMLTYVILDFVVELILAIIFGLMYKDELNKGIEKLKKIKTGERLKYILKFIIFGYVFIMMCNLLCSLVASGISSISGIKLTSTDNQDLVEKLLKENPWIFFILAAITGPFVEETVFRGAVGKVVKNKRVYIAVSGLIFGLMHITDDLVLLLGILVIGVLLSEILLDKKMDKNKKLKTSVIGVVLIIIVGILITYFQYGNILTLIKNIDMEEVLASLSYIGVGCGLAYIYAKEGNLVLNISLHGFINAVAMISLLFF